VQPQPQHVAWLQHGASLCNAVWVLATSAAAPLVAVRAFLSPVALERLACVAADAAGVLAESCLRLAIREASDSPPGELASPPKLSEGMTGDECTPTGCSVRAMVSHGASRQAA
jgi:hypothetical protein